MTEVNSERQPAPHELRVTDVAHGVNLNELIRKYADELERIYRLQTAADHTWTGVLMAFVHELEGL